jgi:diketogulonate reductase-like aldo/keto reductase
MQDLKHKPQVNEWEFNPFLLFDPGFRELHFFELEHDIVNMSKSQVIVHVKFVLMSVWPDYGLLTAASGRIPADQSRNMDARLKSLSAEVGLSPSELLLRWAYDGPCRILVTSTSKAERATSLLELLSEDRDKLPDHVSKEIEEAAKSDGYEGKVFYRHPHMENRTGHVA